MFVTFPVHKSMKEEGCIWDLILKREGSDAYTQHRHIQNANTIVHTMIVTVSASKLYTVDGGAYGKGGGVRGRGRGGGGRLGSGGGKGGGEGGDGGEMGG